MYVQSRHHAISSLQSFLLVNILDTAIGGFQIYSHDDGDASYHLYVGAEADSGHFPVSSSPMSIDAGFCLHRIFEARSPPDKKHAR